jgi:PTH1 family peptidyl-tRNA hydrolase
MQDFSFYSNMKFLIVGLGNIGPEYELTRHNIGFLVLDRLADKFGVQFTSGRYASHGLLKYKGRQFNLIKPATFMNLSGKAVNYWLQELSISQEQMLVVVDEIALPFGSLRMRKKGSAGGHNGLKHIEQTLGTNEYPRLRFGVGGEFPKGSQVDYVLSNFNQEEIDKLPERMDKAVDMIIGFGTSGIDRVMNQHNE